MQWRAFTGRADKGHETRVGLELLCKGIGAFGGAGYFTDTDTTGYICPRSVCMEQLSYICFLYLIFRPEYMLYLYPHVASSALVCVSVALETTFRHL